MKNVYVELPDIVNLFCNELSKDHAYYHSWFSNITMAISDEYACKQYYYNSFTDKNEMIHILARNSAKQFLSRLAMENKNVRLGLKKPRLILKKTI